MSYLKGIQRTAEALFGFASSRAKADEIRSPLCFNQQRNAQKWALFTQMPPPSQTRVCVVWILSWLLNILAELSLSRFRVSPCVVSTVCWACSVSRTGLQRWLINSNNTALWRKIIIVSDSRASWISDFTSCRLIFFRSVRAQTWYW